tara:strand:+ start:13406 stop:13855 length:450 start_codon:yes stop_codon:yes gene_type:complete
MSPLEKIKHGILNNNMQTVADGYKLLTGESVSFNPEQEDTEEDRLVVVEDDETPENEGFIAPIKDKNSTSGRSRLARSEPILTDESRSNKFNDDGTEHVNVETPDAPRSPRNRTAKKLIDIKCHLCGETESVHQDLVRDFYRCSDCCRK